MQVAGANEDGRLGFPTDPPVSELSVLLLPVFVSPLTPHFCCEGEGENKEVMTARTEEQLQQCESNSLSKLFCINFGQIVEA